MSLAFVIAVDGPAASGKGTIADAAGRGLRPAACWTPACSTAPSASLTWRAGRRAGRRATPPTAARGLDVDELGRSRPAHRRGRRGGQPGGGPSRACATPCSSSSATSPASPAGAVLDGRDIGTVIAPDAPAKLFVTATPEVRAERRWKQLIGQGETVAFEDVLADIRAPRRPRRRPRRRARWRRRRDAVLLDTTEMTIDAGRRCGPPHRRGGARPLGAQPWANPTAPFPRPAAGRFHERLRVRPAPSAEPFNPTRDSVATAIWRRAPSESFERRKTSMADDMSMNPSRDDFAALLDEVLRRTRLHRRLRWSRARSWRSKRTSPIIDVGLKTEGRISLKEFGVDDDGKATDQGRRHRRGLPRARRERPGRSGHQPREGPPRRSLDPPGRRLRRRTSRSWAPSSAA